MEQIHQRAYSTLPLPVYFVRQIREFDIVKICISLSPKGNDYLYINFFGIFSSLSCHLTFLFIIFFYRDVLNVLYWFLRVLEILFCFPFSKDLEMAKIKLYSE